MSRKLANLYYRLVLRNPGRLLVAVAIVTLLLAGGAVRLQLDASSDSLLLEDDPELALYQQVNTRFSRSEDFLVVAWSPEQPLFSSASLGRLRALRDALREVPLVAEVRSILDAPLLFQPGYSVPRLAAGVPSLEDDGVDVAAAREELLHSPLYRELLVSKDGTTTALQILLRENSQLTALRERVRHLSEDAFRNAAEDRELAELEASMRALEKEHRQSREQGIAAIRSILERHADAAEVHLGGVPMIVVDMMRFVEQDFLYYGLGLVAFLMIALGLMFRARRWVLIPMAACGVAAVWMTGLLGLFGVRVTVISSNYVSLLLIITMSIIVHMAVRYREYCAGRADETQEQLVLATVAAMAAPCWFMVMTTMVAFGSMLFSGIRPVIDFGLIMAGGVVIAYLVCFLLFPALLVLLPREQAEAQGLARRLTAALASLAVQRRALVLMASILVLALSLLGMQRLQVENRFIDYFKEDTEIHRGMQVIDQRLGGTTPLDIVIETDRRGNPEAGYSPQKYLDAHRKLFNEEPAFVPDSYWYSPEGLQVIDRIQRYLEGRDEIGKVQSLAIPYRLLRDLNLNRPVNSYQLGMIRNFLPESVTAQLIEPYFAPEAHQVRIGLRLHDTDGSLDRNRIIDDIRDFLTQSVGFDADQVHVTGIGVLYNNLLQSLYQSLVATLGFVLLAVVLMLWLLFRSPYLALIAALPNVLVALAVLGLMGWAGISLDIMTITVAAIVLGIGVDDTIHYLHRFRVELEADGDYAGAVSRSHGSVGRAMLYTSVAVSFGFSILLLSNFVPSIYFGLLSSAAMCLALLASLTLLPTLLVTLRPVPAAPERRMQRAPREPARRRFGRLAAD